MVPEMVDESSGPDGKASGGSDRFAECPDSQRHSLFHTKQLTGAPAGLSQGARCMRLVDKHHGIVGVGKITKAVERGEDAVHAEQPVGDNQSSWSGGRLRKLICELIKPFSLIDLYASTAESAAIDQAGVIVLVAENDVVAVDQRGDRAEIRSESRWEQ